MRFELTERVHLPRCIFLLILIISIPLPGHAKSDLVTFGAGNNTLGTVILTIQQQTPYTFAFDNRALDILREVNVAAGEQTLEEALTAISQSAGISYIITDGYIILHSRPKPEQQFQLPEPTGDVYRRTDPDSLGRIYLPGSRERIPIVVPVEDPKRVEFCEPPIPYSSYIQVERYPPMKPLLPAYSMKVNLLYGAATLTPNLAAEFGIGPRSSIEVSGSYNPWHRKGNPDRSNDKFVHWIVRPEYRYWLCERYNGHFFGANAFFSKYNIGGYRIPIVEFKKNKRYEGYAVGVGITYGYHLALHRQWGLEFNLGAGVAHMRYKKTDCRLCGSYDGRENKTYFGPTRAGVALVFIIK